MAFVPEHPRSCYDVEVGGSFPPFVLEVVSPNSTTRDQVEKRRAYNMMAAREYALFTPREAGPSTLEGYRRAASGAFGRWAPDAQGRLWSDVLGLFLVVQGRLLQAQTPGGRLLLTPEQAEFARQRAETERQRAEEELHRAEAEIERLRRELEKYREQDGDR